MYNTYAHLVIKFDRNWHRIVLVFRTKNYLESALCDALDESRVFDDLDRFAGDEVDVLLAVLHARHVVGQGRALLAIIVRRVIPKQLRDLGAVGRVFVDTQLDVSAELVI